MNQPIATLSQNTKLPAESEKNGAQQAQAHRVDVKWVSSSVAKLNCLPAFEGRETSRGRASRGTRTNGGRGCRARNNGRVRSSSSRPITCRKRLAALAKPIDPVVPTTVVASSDLINPCHDCVTARTALRSSQAASLSRHRRCRA